VFAEVNKQAAAKAAKHNEELKFLKIELLQNEEQLRETRKMVSDAVALAKKEAAAATEALLKVKVEDMDAKFKQTQTA